MKNKTLLISTILLCLALLGAGCIKIQEDDSGIITRDLPRPISSCGDRICDEIENSTGNCPLDCVIATSTEKEILNPQGSRLANSMLK